MNDKTDDRLDKILDRSFEYRGEEWQKDKADLKALIQAERIKAQKEVLEEVKRHWHWHDDGSAMGGDNKHILMNKVDYLLAELDTNEKGE
jgi:hypothetical protein